MATLAMARSKALAVKRAATKEPKKADNLSRLREEGTEDSEDGIDNRRH